VNERLRASVGSKEGTVAILETEGPPRQVELSQSQKEDALRNILAKYSNQLVPQAQNTAKRENEDARVEVARQGRRIEEGGGHGQSVQGDGRRIKPHFQIVLCDWKIQEASEKRISSSAPEQMKARLGRPKDQDDR